MLRLFFSIYSWNEGHTIVFSPPFTAARANSLLDIQKNILVYQRERLQRRLRQVIAGRLRVALSNATGYALDDLDNDDDDDDASSESRQTYILLWRLWMTRSLSLVLVENR